MRDRWATAGVVLLAGLVSVMGMPAAVAQQKGNGGACCQPGKTASVTPNAQSGKLKPQTVCPIMRGKIDKEVFVDVAGYRIYACCPSCLAKIKADPEKAVTTLKAKGEKPELRLVVCPKCGEIKGADKCCQPDAKKCSKCGLNRGSIGCCKELKPAPGQKEIVLRAGCGDVKGSGKCCKPDAKGRPKCSLNKGTPGCCKLPRAADQKQVVICPGCGEVKGGDKCCKPGAKKCPQCRLNKGAPGCCKIDRFTKDDG